MLRTLRLSPVAALMLIACSKAPEQTPPPPAGPGKALVVPAAKSDRSVVLEVQPKTGVVTFEMDAPLERQYGEVPEDAVTGSLSLDLEDIGQSTGVIRVDLTNLVIYQEAREDEDSEFGERQKNDTQNEHMRDWLEINEDAPPEQREKNRFVEFILQDVKNESIVDLTTLSGKERKVSFLAIGELHLHQRKTPKEIAIEAVFDVDGDNLKSVEVKTITPFLIDLEAHDVRPRTAFGKLAQKTLETMSPKVGSKVVVSVAFRAAPRGPVQLVSAATADPKKASAPGGNGSAPEAPDPVEGLVPAATAAAEEGS